MKRLTLVLLAAMAAGGCAASRADTTPPTGRGQVCERSVKDYQSEDTLLRCREVAALERIADALEMQVKGECIMGYVSENGSHKTLVLEKDGTCRVDVTPPARPERVKVQR